MIEMHGRFTRGLTVTALITLSALPLTAQSHKQAVGWNGGVLYTTSMNEGAAGEDLKPEQTFAMGMHYDRWIRAGYFGLRVHGAFAKQDVLWNQGPRDIWVYTADLALLIRPMLRTVSPFASLGVGTIFWDLGSGPVTAFPPAGVYYDGRDHFQPTAVAGIGLDWISPWRWGDGSLAVRLEGRDQIQFSSPFEPLDPEQGKLGLIHNIQVSLGVYTGLGVLNGAR